MCATLSVEKRQVGFFLRRNQSTGSQMQDSADGAWYLQKLHGSIVFPSGNDEDIQLPVQKTKFIVVSEKNYTEEDCRIASLFQRSGYLLDCAHLR